MPDTGFGTGIEAVKAAIHLEQLAATDYSVVKFRQEVAALPETDAVRDVLLAEVLTSRGQLLFHLGHAEAALALVDEELGIRRRLAQADPEIRLRSLAEVLVLRFKILMKLGRHEEARADIIEARALLGQAIATAEREVQEAERDIAAAEQEAEQEAERGAEEEAGEGRG
ncbi:MAG TPA: hypothetical protein VGX23_02685 [Actinocrinis sp.]|nr:hypothetical protein [Actinocrinis sp.]